MATIEDSEDKGPRQVTPQVETTIVTSFIHQRTDGDDCGVEQDELEPDSDTTPEKCYSPIASEDDVLPLGGVENKDWNNCEGGAEQERPVKEPLSVNADPGDESVTNGIHITSVNLKRESFFDPASSTDKSGNKPCPPEIDTSARTKDNSTSTRCNGKCSFPSISQPETEPKDMRAREQALTFDLGGVAEDDFSRLFEASSQLTTPPATENRVSTEQIDHNERMRPSTGTSLPFRPSARRPSIVKNTREKYGSAEQAGQRDHMRTASSTPVVLSSRPKPVPIVTEGEKSGKKVSIAKRMQNTLRANESSSPIRSKANQTTLTVLPPKRRLELVDSPPTSPAGPNIVMPTPALGIRKTQKRSKTDSKPAKQGAALKTRNESDAETDSFYDLPGAPTATKKRKLLTRKLPSAGKVVTATASATAR